MNSPDSFVKYVQYAQIVAQIGFFSTTFFCFILVFLTNFGVKRSFGSYTYLLILFPVVGIFFATIEMILYPKGKKVPSSNYVYVPPNGLKIKKVSKADEGSYHHVETPIPLPPDVDHIDPGFTEFFVKVD